MSATEARSRRAGDQTHVNLNPVQFPSSFYDHNAFVVAHLAGSQSPLADSDLTRQDAYLMDDEYYFPSAYRDYMTRHVLQRRHMHANAQIPNDVCKTDKNDLDQYSCIDDDRPYLLLGNTTDPCLFPQTTQMYQTTAPMQPSSGALPEYLTRLPTNTWLPLQCMEAIFYIVGMIPYRDTANLTREACLELLIHRHEQENKYYSGEEPVLSDIQHNSYKMKHTIQAPMSTVDLQDSNSNNASKPPITAHQAMQDFAEDILDEDDEEDSQNSDMEVSDDDNVFKNIAVDEESMNTNEPSQQSVQYVLFIISALVYMLCIVYMVMYVFEQSPEDTEKVTFASIPQQLASAAARSIKSLQTEGLLALAVSSSPFFIIFFGLCSTLLAVSFYHLGLRVLHTHALDKLVISTLVNARFWEKGRTARDIQRSAFLALLAFVAVATVGCYGEITMIRDFYRAAESYTLKNTLNSDPGYGLDSYVSSEIANYLSSAQTAQFPTHALPNASPIAPPVTSLFRVAATVLLSTGIVLQVITALGAAACILYSLVIRTRVRSLARLLSYSSASPAHLQKRGVDIEIIITSFSEKLSFYLACITGISIVRAFSLFFTALTLDEKSRYIGGNAHSSSFFLIFVAIHPMLLLCSMFMAIGDITGETEFVTRLLWRASLIINISEKDKNAQAINDLLSNNSTLSSPEETKSSVQKHVFVEKDLEMLLEYMHTAELTPQIYGHDISSSLFLQIAIGGFAAYASLLKYKYRQFI